jgi:photosystem II stability/assembly factor-like uncharacterized protein
MLAGWETFHMAVDLRHDPPLLYAAANNPWWGPSVARSADGGKTWDQRTTGLGFPKDMGLAIQNVWYVQPGPVGEPGVVYAGTQPPGLFRSDDWGVSWAPVESLTRHEFRAFYQGIGEAPDTGSPLHSIEIDPRDPKRMYVAISGGGSYLTRDGCKTWELFSHHAMPSELRKEMFVSQQLSDVPAGVDPAAVWDMHKFVLDTKAPDRLWTQAHTGVFRSDDAGATWEDVTPPRLDMVVRPAAPTPGLYEFHGFPIAVTQREPDGVYLLPLQADDFRVCPGQLTIYRTRDRGKTWQALTEGLPGPGDYQSAYRERMDTDGLDPEGIYLGTSNGQTYASADGGDHWQRLPGTVPPVLSVTCAVY